MENERLVIINTPTYKDFKEVLENAFNRGRKWCDGKTEISESNWNSYRTSTCIIVRDKYLSYADYPYSVETYDVDILNMEQFRENIRKILPSNFGEIYDLK